MGVLRRCPATLCYLVILLATHLIVFRLLDQDARAHVLQSISTNASAMGWSAPLRLAGSALVVNVSGGVLNIALIVVFGVAGCLGWLEIRLGAVRAFVVFAGAHVLASLLVLAVVAVAVLTGRYPDEVRHELDYGVSFGALGAIGAVTMFLRPFLRPVWAAVALLYPLTAADWYGWLPDYTSLGHVLAAATGLSLTTLLLRHAPSPAPASEGEGECASVAADPGAEFAEDADHEEGSQASGAGAGGAA